MLPFSVDLPSYPQHVTYNITSYFADEYLVKVQWEAPSDGGGVDVSNYIIMMATEGTVKATIMDCKVFPLLMFFCRHFH